MTEHENRGNHAGEENAHHEPTKKAVELKFNIGMLTRNWHLLALIAIFILAFYVRTFNFHYPYLLNVDSYFQYRYIGYVAEGGIPETDTLMLSPTGQMTSLDTGVSNIYHYIGGYSYLIAKTFFPDLELWVYLIYFPAILAGLMVIPSYFIGKSLYDRKAGVLMAFLVTFSPAIFMRSIGGDPDTDAIVMLMPLLVMMFFLKAFESMRKEKEIKSVKTLALSAVTGILTGVYALTWVGFWYILFLIGGFIACILAIEAFRLYRKNEIKKLFSENGHIIANLLVILLLFSTITIPVYGMGFVQRTLTQPFAATNLKAETGDFPNVFVSVQEMMAGGSIKEIVQRAGPVFFFLTYVICLPYMIGSYFYRKKHMEAMVLITLWSLGSLFATIFAVRFSILLAIPLSIGSAIILAKIWRMALGQDKEIFE